MQYLPSKKIVTLMIGIVVVGGFWLFERDSTIKNKTNLTDKSALENFIVQARSRHRDSDNDGLSDWEESLFNTNLRNPDSDNDGLLDGEEFIAEKIYPLINPDEIGDIYALRTGAGGRRFFVQDSSNLTDTLLREAAYRYDFLDQTSGIDEQAAQQLVEGLASDFRQSGQAHQYAMDDLTTVGEINNVSVNAYIAGILLMFSKHSDIDETEPLSLLDTWFETQDESIIDTLSSLQEMYVELSEDMATVPVPDDLALFHLELVNNLSNTAASFNNIQNVSYDPIKSMLATAEYTGYRNRRTQLILALTDYYNDYSLSAYRE